MAPTETGAEFLALRDKIIKRYGITVYDRADLTKALERFRGLVYQLARPHAMAEVYHLIDPMLEREEHRQVIREVAWAHVVGRELTDVERASLPVQGALPADARRAVQVVGR